MLSDDEQPGMITIPRKLLIEMEDHLHRELIRNSGRGIFTDRLRAEILDYLTGELPHDE